MMDSIACLHAMGIDVWVRRDSAVDKSIVIKPEPAIEKLTENFVQEIEAETVSVETTLVKEYFSSFAENDNWEDLENRISACAKCELHTSRTQTVFGVGNNDADWLIIGEAPGAEEDRQGEPFIGRAGQLLNSMLMAVSLRREQVFIANILKCRPPNNRDPHPEEVISCEPYLQRQIELIKPKIILCVGRIAAQNLLKVETPIGKMRGKKYFYEPLEIPVVVTYHPAYLLRSPTQKSKSWEDLLLAKSLMEESS